MKTRILALTLALCLLTGGALAETLTLRGDLSETSPMRDWDPVSKYLTVRSPWLFALEHRAPELTVKLDNKTPLTQEAYIRSGLTADAALLTGPFDWPSLWQNGAFADLTAHDAVASIVGQTYPHIAESVMDNGRIYAVPVSLTTWNTLVWQKDSWAEAGLTAADVPVSFTELLDFMEQWAASPMNDRMAAFDGVQGGHALVLAELLIQHYALQCRTQNTEADYTQANFLALLDRCRMVGEALDRHDAAPGELSLFAVVSGDAQALPYSVMLGMTANDPPVVSVTMNALAIRADSEKMDAARLFLTCYCEQLITRPGNNYTPYHFSRWEHEADLAHAQLFPSADQPVLSDTPFSYPASVIMVSELLALLDEEELLDQQVAEIEPYIPTAQLAVDVFWPRHWYYSAEDLAAYQAVAPFCCPGPVPDMSTKAAQAMLSRWAQGKDSAAALGQALNELEGR